MSDVLNNIEIIIIIIIIYLMTNCTQKATMITKPVLDFFLSLMLNVLITVDLNESVV